MDAPKPPARRTVNGPHRSITFNTAADLRRRLIVSVGDSGIVDVAMFPLAASAKLLAFASCGPCEVRIERDGSEGVFLWIGSAHFPLIETERATLEAWLWPRQAGVAA